MCAKICGAIQNGEGMLPRMFVMSEFLLCDQFTHILSGMFDVAKLAIIMKAECTIE